MNVKEPRALEVSYKVIALRNPRRETSWEFQWRAAQLHKQLNP